MTHLKIQASYTKVVCSKIQIQIYCVHFSDGEFKGGGGTKSPISVSTLSFGVLM